MNKTITWIVIIIIAAAVIWFAFGKKETQAPTEIPVANETSGMPVPGTNTPEMEVVVESEISVTPPPKEVTVNYTDAGFSPQTVTIASGGKVTWVNQSTGSMWVASAIHPTHSVYNGTTLSQHCPGTSGAAFDQCSDGKTYSFTFNKVGEWGYHDHLNSKYFGKIIVK